MKKHQKFVSRATIIMLVIMVLILPTGNSYASTIVPEEGHVDLGDIKAISNSFAEDTDEEEILDVVEKIEYLGFDATDISANNELNPVITFQQNGNTSVVEVESATEDTLKMCVSEGTISNEVIINNDGTAYIDGNLVQQCNSPTSTNGVVFMNAFQDHYQLACPYGTASNYGVYARTVRNFNVDFTKMAKNLTILAFTTIISLQVWYLGPLWGTCYEVASYFKTYDPFSGSGSFISKEYVHTKGYFVTSSLAVRKCVLTLFSRKNYEGKAITRTVYLCHQYTY
jgi:hypothetical protein